MKINQSQPFLGMTEYEAIKECFENNWITEGPKSKEFSEKLCKKMGCKYGVFAPNGTLALYLGLRALGIGPGDEVIIPDFTFIASANSVEMTGAKPIFADIDRDTLHVNIEECEKLITEHTKAIMPVHIYGAAANMDKIMAFAKKYNLKVIEDAAQAIGVYWNKKHCGTFGEVGCFSFFADKTITTGEGGFVCTNDKKIYNELIYLRNQGRLNRGSFIHSRIGYNFRITDLQAAIGLVQLDKLKLIEENKLKIFDLYKKNLQGVDGLRIIVPEEGSNFIPFRIAILFEKKSDKISEYLISKDIESRTFFYPIHKQPCYKNCDCVNDNCNNFPNSKYVYDHGLCFPAYAELGEKEIIYICNHIKKALKV